MNVTPDPAVGVKAEAWQPQAPEGMTADDLTIGEWVGQGIGRASVCWVGGTGDLQFDSSAAQAVADALTERFEALMQDVARDTIAMLGEAHVFHTHRGPNLGLASTRQLLEELEARFRVGVLPNARDAVAYLLDPETGLHKEHLDYKTVDEQ